MTYRSHNLTVKFDNLT